MSQTTSHTSRRLRRSSVGALALSALTLAACGGDDDKTTTTLEGVEVSALGAEDGRIELPGTAEVGQTASGTIAITTDLTLSGAGIDNEVSVDLRIDHDTEVVEVAEDGGYTSEMTFTDAAMDAPAGAESVDVESLAGLTIRQSFGADGTPGEAELANESELSSQQIEAYETIQGDLATTTMAYPDEPVGVGATWQATVRSERQGFELPVTYGYELVEVDGDEYVIEVSYDEEIDTEVSTDGETADVSGTIVGDGTITGSATDPLQATQQLEQQMDIDIAADGQSLDMQMDFTVDVGVDGR